MSIETDSPSTDPAMAFMAMAERAFAQRDALRTVLRRLVVAARTSGGVAGRDETLCAACDEAESALLLQEGK